MIRYRLRWSRSGKVRYLSAHDLASVFERATRRAKLPLVYSNGFSPHPKIGFATALAVGYGSSVELMDMTLLEPIDAGALRARMNEALPEGLRIEAATVLPQGATKLGRVAAASDYSIEHGCGWIPDALARFMSLEHYEIQRPFKGSVRRDDLRSGVVEAEADESSISMRCTLVPKAVRPSDVVAALADLAGREPPHVKIERVRLLHEAEEGLVPIDEQGVGGMVGR